ncbi:hypothetical protein TPHA_0I00550 [Tetrapisispora phaffii CBS 4417]|uniref:Mitochondrial group I intron splicing factor CCM1 n=1 Tax=Tetrapisispora phaffii (strain ATCC 24235 / CBS 4417 / NBRC 1672 / NRRL Y-8282 / UCD 70-5) TaxID=1071381 RepID=G8BXD3_TETPH|nr:hypothetical protein TPHA_0I00550 [Tetrapisispora phaffii CBS 4417]CCE64561.1 hypothetical protein TPHA_0I00550 [Tetrapisispora phaffii CBS 4417]
MIKVKQLLLPTSRIPEFYFGISRKSICEVHYRSFCNTEITSIKLDQEQNKTNSSAHNPERSTQNLSKFNEVPNALLQMSYDMHHSTTKNNNTIQENNESRLISEVVFKEKWKLKFIEADPMTIKNILVMIRSNECIFSISQMLLLVKCLETYNKEYHIYVLARAYLKLLPNLRDDSNEFHGLLVHFLRTASKLGDYRLCEELFSLYIKLPIIDPKIIRIGLQAFIKNDNFDLAKEFYIQVLNNPETFPMFVDDLYSYLLDLFQYKDYEAMDYAYKLWLLKKCSIKIESKFDPNRNVLSLMHKTYMKSSRSELLDEFLKDAFVKRQKYIDSTEFKLIEFYNKLHQDHLSEPVNIEELHTNIDNFINLIGEDREILRGFYLSVLDILITKKNIQTIQYLTTKIHTNLDIAFDTEFLVLGAKYFVRTGSVQNLVDYYTHLMVNKHQNVNNNERVQLNQELFLQFRDCLVNKYPFLVREITNELRIFTKDRKLLNELYWLKNVDKNLSRISKKQALGGTEYQISYLNDIDYYRYDTFCNQLKLLDLKHTEETLNDIIRGRTRPSLELCYLMLQDSLNMKLPRIINLLHNYLRDAYKQLPIKFDILWLKQNIKESEALGYYHNRGGGRFGVIEEIKVREIVNKYKGNLTIFDYLKLAHIAINNNSFKIVPSLLESSYLLLNKDDSKNWYYFYLASLKYTAREYNYKNFLFLLKNWNNNEQADYLTNGCIRQLKSFTKIFIKRMDKIEDYDKNIMDKIDNEVEILKNRYINKKFEGLNDITLATSFLKKWIEHDIDLKFKALERKKANNIQQYTVTKAE